MRLETTVLAEDMLALVEADDPLGHARIYDVLAAIERDGLTGQEVLTYSTDRPVVGPRWDDDEVQTAVPGTPYRLYLGLVRDVAVLLYVGGVAIPPPRDDP